MTAIAASGRAGHAVGMKLLHSGEQGVGFGRDTFISGENSAEIRYGNAHVVLGGKGPGEQVNTVFSTIYGKIALPTRGKRGRRRAKNNKGSHEGSP